jgi:glutaredoxin
MRRDEMIEKSGQMGVPVIEIDGEIVVGFDKNRLDALLMSKP